MALLCEEMEGGSLIGSTLARNKHGIAESGDLRPWSDSGSLLNLGLLGGGSIYPPHVG